MELTLLEICAQNEGKSISGDLKCENFLGGMPPDPLEGITFGASLRADVSYFLPPAEKGRLRNGVANHFPVSCCSGFKFHINYDNTVLFSVPESFPSDRSMIGGRTGLRGGI